MSHGSGFEGLSWASQTLVRRDMAEVRHRMNNGIPEDLWVDTCSRNSTEIDVIWRSACARDSSALAAGVVLLASSIAPGFVLANPN